MSLQHCILVRFQGLGVRSKSCNVLCGLYNYLCMIRVASFIAQQGGKVVNFQTKKRNVAKNLRLSDLFLQQKKINCLIGTNICTAILNHFHWFHMLARGISCIKKQTFQKSCTNTRLVYCALSFE